MAGIILRSAVAACCMTLADGSGRAQQNAPEEILQTTRDWLKSASEANRAGLNAIMDSRSMVITPAGEVQPKERLVPDAPAQSMSRLKATGGATPALNATFVYSRRDNAWKLIALHLSSR